MEVFVVKKIVIQKEFQGKEFYNVKSVFSQFSDYFDMELGELFQLFQDYSVISFQNISSYIENHLDLMEEKEKNGYFSDQEIVKRRKRDYQYFCKTLDILSKKGLECLSILKYLNGDCFDIDFENVLYDMGIYHYGEFVLGKDLNRIQIALQHIIMQFNSVIEQVNCLETYQRQVIDDFAYYYGGDRIYPVSSLMLDADSERMDKTSILVPNNSFLGDKMKNKKIRQKIC